MALAIASKASSEAGTNGDITITKPSGLAIGDLLLAFINSAASGGGPQEHEAPAGWTKLQGQSSGQGFTVWAKIATSTETAASNFTWTSAGDNVGTVGAIFRITSTVGFMSVTQQCVSVSNTGLTGAGVTTPSSTNLLFLCGTDEDSADRDIAGYAIVNNNPTWNEEYDLDSGSSPFANMGIASASYPYKQATGNVTVTSTGDGVTAAYAIVAIGEAEDGSASPAVVDLTLSPQAPTLTASAVASPSVVQMTLSALTPLATAIAKLWNFTSKPSTNWDFEDKP